MSTSPIRLNPSLISAAEREGLMQKRSTPKQIEFWADLGRAVERVIDLSDVFAVLQGLKRLKLENVESVSVEADDVFDDLQKNNFCLNISLQYCLGLFCEGRLIIIEMHILKCQDNNLLFSLCLVGEEEAVPKNIRSDGLHVLRGDVAPALKEGVRLGRLIEIDGGPR